MKQAGALERCTVYKWLCFVWINKFIVALFIAGRYHICLGTEHPRNFWQLFSRRY
jgi:hypothetical protein